MAPIVLRDDQLYHLSPGPRVHETLHVEGLRDLVPVAQLERQAIRHHPGGPEKRGLAIPDGVWIHLEREKAVELGKHRGNGKADGVLEVTALSLEVVLSEVHALIPDHPGKCRKPHAHTPS